MPWYNSADVLSKLIPFAQLVIVLLTVFTIWASVQRGRIDKTSKDKLNNQLSTLSTSTQTLEKKNADLQKALESSDTELNSLRQQVSPRLISDSERGELIKRLSPPPKFRVIIVCRMMDTECLQFGEQIHKILKEAKWKVGDINRTFIDDVKGDLTVVTKDDEQDATGTRIYESFTMIGLNVNRDNIREGSISGIGEKAIILVIGSKKH